MLRRQQQGCAALLLLALLLPTSSGPKGVNAKFRGAKPKPIPSVTADGQVLEGKASPQPWRELGMGLAHHVTCDEEFDRRIFLPARHRCR